MFRSVRILVLLLVFSLIGIGFTVTSAQETTPEPDLAANKALVEQFVAVLNSHDLSGLDALLSADFVEHDPFIANPPPGPDGFKVIAQALLTAFPDVNVHVDLVIAEGDLVATRHSVTATQTGPFNGVPASGKEVTWTENHIFRIADGKIVEHWAELDTLNVLTQIGAIPAPASK